MSVTYANRSVPLGATSTFRVVSLFERAADAFAAWRNARATAVALADLSDKQLADIGLSRGEIAEVAETLAHR
ncbi:MAG: DUF1127 domain-containing protein [Rhodobacteraceae bacterium]|nr:DUF1127 domain-containing protein [Paracoccaceae bacterium]